MGFLEAGRHGHTQLQSLGFTAGLRDSRGAPVAGSMASTLLLLGACSVALVAGCTAGLVTKWNPEVAVGVPYPVRLSVWGVKRKKRGRHIYYASSHNYIGAVKLLRSQLFQFLLLSSYSHIFARPLDSHILQYMFNPPTGRSPRPPPPLH